MMITPSLVPHAGFHRMKTSNCEKRSAMKESFDGLKRDNVRTDAGVLAGSACQSGSRSMIRASTSEIVSPSNGRASRSGTAPRRSTESASCRTGYNRASWSGSITKRWHRPPLRPKGRSWRRMPGSTSYAGERRATHLFATIPSSPSSPAIGRPA